MTVPRPLARGNTFRGYLEYLHRVDAFRSVLAAIPAETRPMLDDPPHGTEWIDIVHNLNLFRTYDAMGGPGAVRAMVYETTRDSSFFMVRPVVQMALSVFGMTPATLLSRAELFLRFNVRGQRFHFAPSGPRSGTIEIRLVGEHPPRAFFDAWAGIATYVFEVCGTKGTAEVREVEDEGTDGLGWLDLAWEQG
jgi:hypothetical protein